MPMICHHNYKAKFLPIIYEGPHDFTTFQSEYPTGKLQVTSVPGNISSITFNDE